MINLSENRYYLCIDMKCFYASVECAERSLNPFETNLVVADPTRGKNALCLAISPRLKSLGVKNRCRISEIPKGICYITAMPRMKLYIDYCADIYELYLNYFSSEDIHTYSIDESFIDVTNYLRIMKTDAVTLAKKLIDEIADKLHIPATAGVGTNLYLAKAALDITAKHTPSHIGFLDEEKYRSTLWTHTPITDFWMVASGTARRLKECGIFTMRDITEAPEELIYKLFGKNAELLIDHAYGKESCLISDIKNYRAKSKSVSLSQILPCDYTFSQSETVMKEMTLNGVRELTKRKQIAGGISIGIGYSNGTCDPDRARIRLEHSTALYSKILPPVMSAFSKTAKRNIPIRRLGISFGRISSEESEGYDLFTDFEAVMKEKKRESTVLSLYEKFGKNSVLTGTDFLEFATQRERNEMIGGHKA